MYEDMKMKRQKQKTIVQKEKEVIFLYKTMTKKEARD